MIIDDSEVYRKSLAKMITDLGHEVAGSYSCAKDALKAIPKASVDLIISDIVMPEVSGIELCEHVNSTYKSLGIILISSINTPNIVLDAISCGALDFLPKPVSHEDLSCAIEKSINMMDNAI